MDADKIATSSRASVSSSSQISQLVRLWDPESYFSACAQKTPRCVARVAQPPWRYGIFRVAPKKGKGGCVHVKGKGCGSGLGDCVGYACSGTASLSRRYQYKSLYPILQPRRHSDRRSDLPSWSRGPRGVRMWVTMRRGRGFRRGSVAVSPAEKASAKLFQ